MVMMSRLTVHLDENDVVVDVDLEFIPAEEEDPAEQTNGTKT